MQSNRYQTAPLEDQSEKTLLKNIENQLTALGIIEADEFKELKFIKKDNAKNIIGYDIEKLENDHNDLKEIFIKYFKRQNINNQDISKSRNNLLLKFHPDKNLKYKRFASAISVIINGAYAAAVNEIDKIKDEENTNINKNINKLEDSISMSSSHIWAFKRFFLNNDKHMFKEFCLSMPLGIKYDERLNEGIKKNLKYIDNLKSNSHKSKHLNLIENSINIINEALSKRTVELTVRLYELNSIKEELCTIQTEYITKLKQQINNKALWKDIELINQTQQLVDMAISRDIIDETVKKYRKSDHDKKLSEVLLEKLSDRLQEQENKAKKINELKSDLDKICNDLNNKRTSLENEQSKLDSLFANIKENSEQIQGLKLEICIMHFLIKESKKQNTEEILNDIKENAYKKILKELKDSIEEKLNPDTLNIAATLILYITYTFIFTVIAPGIQLSLFGAMLLGGSIVGNIIFGAIASSIATIIAITISNIRNKIDSNTLFNTLFLCAIFAYYMTHAPLIGLSSQIVFALVSTVITYNILNTIELLIENIFSYKIFIYLSYYKDVIRELLLIIALLPIGEIILHRYRSLQNYYKLRKMEIYEKNICIVKNNVLLEYVTALFAFFFNHFFWLALTFFTITLLKQIIIVDNIYIAIIFVLYIAIFENIERLPDIKMPRLYTTTVNYLSQLLENICNNILRYFNHSHLIKPFIQQSFKNYRDMIPELTKLNHNNEYINYAIGIITFIVQSAIDITLFPVFTLLYSAYTAIDAISKNTIQVLNNNPVIITAAFIIISVISAVFASPIQLFILGKVAVTSSTIMNIIFGIMSGMLSIIFGTNAYTLIDTSEIEYINISKLYETSVRYLSKILGSIYSKTIKYFEDSYLIQSFNKYRNTIPALTKLSTKSKYLKYPVNAIISIVQTIIDIALFPVFAILYFAYTAIDAISKNTLKTLNNHPVIITAAFIVIAVISAVFASPIQLFVLSTVVMAGSPIMNILFGTMSGIISTTFATNAYVVINTVAMPYISSSFKGAGEAFNSFCENYMPCCNKSSKKTL